MGSLRVAVDIGGTFTDVCVMDEATGAIHVAKAASTPDPVDGFLNGLAAAGVRLSEVALLSHGTTIATNALITRRLPRAAMLCSEGFRDVIEIRRANKEDLWDVYKDVARPYIPRRDRLTVRERVDAAGQITTPLDEAGVREAARILKKRQVAAVAVCFMNAFINPANEQRAKAILSAELPDVPVTTSSETLPEIFEHERFSTTVINAILNPVAAAYCMRLGERLKQGGYTSDLLLLHSGGGVMTTAGAQRFAARLAGSGIAAGAIASRHIAVQCGFPNSIGLDMGGTSCDVSLATEGRSRVTKDWFIEFGYPIRFPSIEVLTIGAGGGSLATIDDAGGLHSGPQSASASPGPACYGHGNTVPTNSDANLVLGRLGSGLAGGSVRLHPDLAEQAVRDGIAIPLGLELYEAAEAIVRVANANMADAVRLISISRGYDPRDFALVAFGGAGPLHGAALARELAIPVVIVPPYPGVTSALGCLLVDVQHDLAESYLFAAEQAEPASIETAFARLEAEALERLHHEGITDDRIVLERSIDMMYRGQWRSLAVPAASPVPPIVELTAAFHLRHEQEYNFRRDDTPIDLYRLNLRAVGVVAKAEFASHELHDTAPVATSRRTVWFDGQAHDTLVYARAALSAGTQFVGPAIVEQVDSTALVPPGAKAHVDRFLNLIIRMES